MSYEVILIIVKISRYPVILAIMHQLITSKLKSKGKCTCINSVILK